LIKSYPRFMHVLYKSFPQVFLVLVGCFIYSF